MCRRLKADIWTDILNGFAHGEYFYGMVSLFTILMLLFLTPQFCICNEFSAKMQVILMSRDQKNRTSSTFLQAISTTTVCERFRHYILSNSIKKSVFLISSLNILPNATKCKKRLDPEKIASSKLDRTNFRLILPKEVQGHGDRGHYSSILLTGPQRT